MITRTFQVGDTLPQILTREELAGYIRKSLSRFDELRKAGTHPAIKEILPRSGAPVFCGRTAQAWAEGRLNEDGTVKRPHFGSKARIA